MDKDVRTSTLKHFAELNRDEQSAVAWTQAANELRRQSEMERRQQDQEMFRDMLRHMGSVK